MFFTFPFPSTASTTTSSFFGSLDNFLPVETVRAEFRGWKIFSPFLPVSSGFPPVSHHVSHSRLRKLSSDRGMLQHSNTQTVTHTHSPTLTVILVRELQLVGGEWGGRGTKYRLGCPAHTYAVPKPLSLALSLSLTPSHRRGGR